MNSFFIVITSVIHIVVSHALALTIRSSPVNVTVPDTPSGFQLQKNGTNYLATSKLNPEIKIEIDCDNDIADGHYFSIVPIINGKRLDGPIWGTKIGLIGTDDDAGVNECTSVQLINDHLKVSYITGSYKNLLSTGPDRPVPLDADFYLDNSSRLVTELKGLYYILPTTLNTSVKITSNGSVISRNFNSPTTDTLEYFENVTFIDVNDSVFGHFTVETNILLLQLQHDAIYDRFEFDYDHSYKDRGQEIVTSKVTFY